MTPPEVLTDIKRSIIENIRARLPDIASGDFSPDPPVGEYNRPCFYLTFLKKIRSVKGRRFGSAIYDYTFQATVEVKEGPGDTERRSRQIENLFREDELLRFYHFVGEAKYKREGHLKVVKFTLSESNKNREKNLSSGELLVTY